MLANYVSDKALISSIYKEIKNLQEKSKQLHQKVGERYEQTLPKRRHLSGQQTYLKKAHHHWSLENLNKNHNEIPSHAS